MTLTDISSHIQAKGFITIAEPACGAGGMLIAVAHVIQSQGYNPAEVIFFDATDISKPCYNMAYLQTSILGLSGYVRHGNSLSLEQWEGRFTPICRVYPHRTQKFLNSFTATDDSQSTQTPPDHPCDRPLPLVELGWDSPVHHHPQQTALFDFTQTPPQSQITTRTRKPPKQPHPTQAHELAQAELF